MTISLPAAVVRLIRSSSSLCGRSRSFNRLRISPIGFSGPCPIVSPRLFRQSWTMKMASTVRLEPDDRLIILRRLDSSRKWESLDDRRFCRCCNKFISGRQIEILNGTTARKPTHLSCPTINCPGNVDDWVYPNEVAQLPDRWGRRAIRVIDKNGEKFVVCGRSDGYSRRQRTQKLAFRSKTAA